MAWGIWSYNVNVFVDITTDRKTWHKIGQVNETNGQWMDFSVSLNDFIGCKYVQPRIRFEGSGEGTQSSSKYILIDDLYVDFRTNAVNEPQTTETFNLRITPNPSTGAIRIITGMEKSYSVSVYNLWGIKTMQKDGFSDGTLDLSLLPKGTYFISVDNGTDRITKRVVLK